MIGADEIRTAERLLKVVAGEDPQRGFEHYRVERMAYENFHQEMMSLFIRRMQQQGLPVNNRMIPTINTLMVHHFMVGIVCGRGDSGASHG